MLTCVFVTARALLRHTNLYYKLNMYACLRATNVLHWLLGGNIKLRFLYPPVSFSIRWQRWRQNDCITMVFMCRANEFRHQIWQRQQIYLYIHTYSLRIPSIPFIIFIRSLARSFVCLYVHIHIKIFVQGEIKIFVHFIENEVYYRKFYQMIYLLLLLLFFLLYGSVFNVRLNFGSNFCLQKNLLSLYSPRRISSTSLIICIHDLASSSSLSLLIRFQ